MTFCTVRTMPCLLSRSLAGRRAMSFVELIIASTIFALVGVFVVYLSLATARLSKDSIQDIRAGNRARSAVETARKRLMPAEFDTVVITNTGPTTGRTITFDQQVDDLASWSDHSQPPPKIRITSALSLETVTNSTLGLDNELVLIYKPDATETDYSDYILLQVAQDVTTAIGRASSSKGVILRGVQDLSFTFEEDGRMVRVEAAARSFKTNESGATVDRPIRMTDTVRFRNESN